MTIKAFIENLKEGNLQEAMEAVKLALSEKTRLVTASIDEEVAAQFKLVTVKEAFGKDDDEDDSDKDDDDDDDDDSDDKKDDKKKDKKDKDDDDED